MRSPALEKIFLPALPSPIRMLQAGDHPFARPNAPSWQAGSSPIPPGLTHMDSRSFSSIFPSTDSSWSRGAGGEKSQRSHLSEPALAVLRHRSSRGAGWCKQLTRGWIESGERAGEVGKPALEPAALARPLVSGLTGNTSPCSPRQTCSQQGWWWPGGDRVPHSQVMEATDVFWGASTHTVHPAASPKSLGCSTRLPSLVRRRLLRLKTRPCMCVCVIKPDSASSCRHPHRRAGRYGRCSPQGFSHAAGSARSSFPATAEPPAPSLVTRNMSSFPLCHNRGKRWFRKEL